jgi:DNA/RNA-binding domain of Phe-tRNA-synthetase-like protein
VQVHLDPHPLLELGLVRARLPRALGELPSPEWLVALLGVEEAATDDATRAEARNLLRPGGYKPTGRGKPASEYLVRAAEEGTLSPINLAVDVNNAVSLRTGLAISVVDPELLEGALRVARGAEGEGYVFNASGQEIRVDGLLCLHDGAGPCANAVRDSQRTKTHAGSHELLYLVWGTSALEGRAARAVTLLAELLERAGVEVGERSVLPAPAG